MVLMKVPADSMLGKYSELMPYLCAKEGMKPVCNDPAACKSDPASLYIGQTGKLTSAAGRSAKGGAPKGLAKASKHFAATCGYSGKGKPVVCEGIKGGVSTPPASNPGFVCGRKGPRLGPGTNLQYQAPLRVYTFKATKLASQKAKGTYGTLMVAECAKLGMKPVCDQRQACRFDVSSLYVVCRLPFTVCRLPFAV